MPKITMSARRLAIVSAALLSALGAAGLVAQQVRAQRPAVAAPARPALSVSTISPQPRRLPLTVAANGSITAWQEASVGSEANGWRLAEVLVNVGDTVKRGQPLARFAAEMVRAELAQSRAGLAEAEAVAAEAAANAGRARELQPSGALSAQQIQQLLTAERTASARVEALRAALEVHRLRLAQTEVLAPDDGIVSARMATVGAVVPAGQELFRLIRGGRLEWRAEVAATEIAAIRPGQAVRVQPAGAPALVGRVRMLAPTVDAATRNALVYVDLPASPGAVRAGMFARGDFEIGHSDALTLPQSAVLLRDGFAWVLKVGADGRVQQAKVGVGRRVGDLVEVTGGVDAGSPVVASGGAFLADGDLVRVVAGRPPAASAPAAQIR